MPIATLMVNALVLFASFLSAPASSHSPYFKVDKEGYVTSSRWKDRISPSGEWSHSRRSPGELSIHVPGFGTILGGVHEGVEYFLGMPYAQPPLGALRFKPAVEIGLLNGSLSATQFCPSVIGASDIRQRRHITLPNDAKVRSHEDALCVNIWRPRRSAHRTKKLPVMVFIYGGGFVSGSSTNAWYDGNHLAQYHDRIVVTFNYRVGPLGFFSNEDLVSATSGTGGANGLLDQVLALKWVQKHVEAFGGDPSSVGLFGESAGALSVCSHIVSPKSAGLFKRAILQSGACNGPWGAGERRDGLEISRLLMAKLGCTTVDCMRSLPSSSLSSWPWSFEKNQSLMSSWKLTPFVWEFPGYWVDGFFLPAQQHVLFEEATINADAVMVVANSMDGFLTFLYPDATFPEGKSAYSSAQDYHWQHFSSHRPIAADVKSLYPCREGNFNATPVADALWQFSLADRDYNLHCASNVLAQILHKRGVPVWRGTFSIGPRRYDQACLDNMIPCCQEGVECYGWASHGAEIPFVFNTTHNACESESVCGEFKDPFTGREPVVVRSMQEYWSSFLATGKPVDASGAGPAWPQADAGIIVFDTPFVSFRPNPMGRRCEFWSQLYPRQTPVASVVV